MRLMTWEAACNASPHIDGSANAAEIIVRTIGMSRPMARSATPFWCEVCGHDFSCLMPACANSARTSVLTNSVPLSERTICVLRMCASLATICNILRIAAEVSRAVADLSSATKIHLDASSTTMSALRYPPRVDGLITPVVSICKRWPNSVLRVSADFNRAAFRDLPMWHAGQSVNSARSRVVKEPHTCGKFLRMYRMRATLACPRH